MSDSLDPLSREAARALLARKCAELVKRRQRLTDERKRILHEGFEVDRSLNDCRAAARVLQIELEIPDEDERDVLERQHLFRLQREADLRERERERQLQARRVEVLPPAAPRFAAQDLLSKLATKPAPGPTATSSRPPIRELVLEQLKAAGNAGLKAASMQDFIEKTYKENLHSKTVGMTLYRLSKDGLARRDGHIWFYVPPTAETENPGAATPGPNNSGSEERR
jgi:hypothetical protein